MAADTFRGGILPGIVGAVLALLVAFISVVFTGGWEKMMAAADIEYVDKQDATIIKTIEQNKIDNERAHQEIRDDIKGGFKELKEGQDKNTDRIIDVVKEQ